MEKQRKAQTAAKKSGGHSTAGRAGRKPKDPKVGKRVTVTITMTPDHHHATKGNHSEIVECALNLYFSKFQLDDTDIS